MELFQKPMGSLIYMPNHSGKNTWSLVHGSSRFLDWWPIQNRAFSPTLGQTLLKRCNLKTLQSKISFLFITCIFLWEKLGIGIKNSFLWMMNKKLKKNILWKKVLVCSKGPPFSPSNILWLFFPANVFFLIFFFNIHKKCIWYQFKIFVTKICT